MKLHRVKSRRYLWEQKQIKLTMAINPKVIKDETKRTGK